jgi:Flp pilus assembly protein TadD
MTLRFAALSLTLLGALAAVPDVASAMGSGSPPPSSTAAPSGNTEYLKAERAVKDKDFKGAIPLLEKVVTAEPKNASALNYLGYSHRKLGDKDKALAFYRQALDIEPNHPGANEYLGELYLEMDNLQAAEGRLWTLEQTCARCEETRELKDAIQKYKAKKS